MVKNRSRQESISIEERKKTFNEVELGFSEETAIEEARRCLTCEVGICIGCRICSEICPDGIIFVETEKDKEGIDYPVDYKIDITRCMFCGLCAEACPTKTLVFTDKYELAEYDKKKLTVDMMKGKDDN